MKTFTCREMGGPCDEQFAGETMQAVADMGGAHIMNSTDEAHAAMKDQMMKSSSEDKQKWMDWFQGEWDKKS